MARTKIKELLEARRYKKLKQQLTLIHPADIPSLFEELSEKQVLLAFRLLSKEEAAEAFTYMSSEVRESLVAMLNDEEIREVFEELYIDDTVDIIEELPANVVERLLAMTDEDTRERINEILDYPEDSAGSIMTVEYISLKKEMTVAEGIRKIRHVGINKETIYTCYVTEKKRLLGYVSLVDLLSSEDEEQVEKIMDTNIKYVHTHDDQEDVAKLTRKYGLLAVPVVDNENCLVGIVTVDDAMTVVQDETTEDMNKMAALLHTDDDYFSTGVWQHAMNRVPWLLFLMLSATMSGMIITHYEALTNAVPLLISFVPMIMGTGGNTGSQSATLVIRGISVDEIRFSDIWKVVWKETRVALEIGIFLAIINGIRVVLMYQNLSLSIVLGFTLIFTILISKLIGCLLPLFASKLKLDPAIMAGPLITTLVDSCSVLIYFFIVNLAFVYLV